MSAGIEGLHVFMNEVFEKEFGYNRQATLALENDLSNAAENTGHWTMGQAVTANPDGQFKQRTRTDQGARVFTERSKREMEGMYRSGNRLSVGTERWIDDDDHSKGRESILNEYAMKEIENWESLSSLADRKRINTSTAKHIMEFNTEFIDSLRARAKRDGKYESNEATKFKGFKEFEDALRILAGQDSEGRADPNAPVRGSDADLKLEREKLRQWGKIR